MQKIVSIVETAANLTESLANEDEKRSNENIEIYLKTLSVSLFSFIFIFIFKFVFIHIPTFSNKRKSSWAFNNIFVNNNHTEFALQLQLMAKLLLDPLVVLVEEVLVVKW